MNYERTILVATKLLVEKRKKICFDRSETLISGTDGKILSVCNYARCSL